ncbi:hypothetical protein JCM17960_07890 [Magnetospira thiophila]
MRGCQYFGLMWVLCAIAAAVMPQGLLMGIFGVLSALSGGLAVHLLGRDMGLWGEPPGTPATAQAPRAGSPAQTAAPPDKNWKNRFRESFGKLVK